MKTALRTTLTTALRRAKGTKGTQMTTSRIRNTHSNVGARLRMATPLRVVVSLIAALAMALGAALTSGLVAHANPTPVTDTFSSTGAEQTFTVPAGVTSTHIVATGGSGGSETPAGGLGGVVTGDLTVTPGQTLYVEVGGAARNNGVVCDVCIGGFNGGGTSAPGAGGGGGASDVRTIASADSGTLDSRLIVAGGGGGDGDSGSCIPFAAGGGGGNAGSNGGPGTSCGSLAAGGGGAAGAAYSAAGEEAQGIHGGAGGGGLMGGGAGRSGAHDSTTGYTAGGGGGGGTNLVPNGGTASVAATAGDGSVTISYASTDTTAPTTTATIKGTTGNSPWYISDVSVTLSASDQDNDASTLTTYYAVDNTSCAPTTETTDCQAYGTTAISIGAGTHTLTDFSVDPAGNAETPQTQSFDVDTLAPSASPSLNPSAPVYTDGLGNQWYKGPVTATWTWADNTGGSGVDADHCTTSSSSRGDGPQALAASCADKAGNVGNASTGTLFVDATAPAVSFTTCPTNPVLLNGSASATWSASDEKGSGLATVSSGTTTLATGSVGKQSVSAPVATDHVGFTSNTATCAYAVHYQWSGFAQPINDPVAGATTMSVFKAGSTIPVKFQLHDANGAIVQAGSAPTFSVSAPQACSSSSVDASGTTESGDTGSSYRWDSTSQQYIYNYHTDSSLSGMCQYIQATLDDGTTQRVEVAFK